MAQLGNTIINGVLRVNGNVNLSGTISASAFTGNLTGNVTGNVSGNAGTATKLQTARTINGVSFDGSSNITTANWGTARNIGIVNSDGTGTAVTVSVNGAGNVNLKLPATIKASLTGNADTSSSAAKLTTARTINGVSFDGSANITIADSTKLPLSGGTMTGNISYNMNSSTQIPFKIYGGDVNGQGVSVGAGGATIIGSGESAKACESLLTATTEELWVTSDNEIKFYTNCQTIGNKVGVFLNAARAFYPDKNNTGTLGTSSNKWNNVYATTFTGSLSGNATNVTQKKSLTGKSHSNYGTNNGYVPDMSFIAYWNGAYSNSNASNLTYAHQGTIQCKPTVLYSNASGTKGTVTLNQTATNFSYIDIYYLNNNGVGDTFNRLSVSQKGNMFELSNIGFYLNNGDNINGCEIRTSSYKLSGTTITVTGSSYTYIRNKAVNWMDNNNNIYIYKVIGWK